MGIPSQVRPKLCIAALVLLPLMSDGNGGPSRSGAQAADPPCVDPSSYTRSVVSIAWYFDKERLGRAGVAIVGERATAWFYGSPRILVTAAHFARELPAQGWQEVELRQAASDGAPDVMVRTQARIVYQGDFAERDERKTASKTQHAEDLAIFELRDSFPDAQPLEIGPEPPSQDETILVLGYPGGRLHVAHGVVRRAEDPAGKYAGLTLFEVQGSNRLLLKGGASGAPVLDCQHGRVTAVLNGLLTGPSLPFLPPGQLVVPTPWGAPTNTAVPAALLRSIANLAP
jgi:hypothetical protein